MGRSWFLPPQWDIPVIYRCTYVGPRFVEGREYRICSLERLSTALRQSYIIELVLVDQLCIHFFDRNFWIHSCGFQRDPVF